jgi:hypothetical protein
MAPGGFFGKQLEILKELVPGASKIALRTEFFSV